MLGKQRGKLRPKRSHNPENRGYYIQGGENMYRIYNHSAEVNSSLKTAKYTRNGLPIVKQ